MRVCHYTGYNLHALWWGPFIQLLPPPPPPSSSLTSNLQYHLALLQIFIHTSIHGSFSTIPAAVIKKSLVISFLNPPTLSSRPRNELATYARLFTYVFFYDFISCKNKQFCYNVYWLVLAGIGIGDPKGSSACFLMCP